MSKSKIRLFEQIQEVYFGTQAEIEALTGVTEGSVGYATDRDPYEHFGTFNGTDWEWDTAASGYTPPTTTAANDFQVGDGSGNWIKKTLAQTITILRTSLDSAYAAFSHSHSHGSLTGIGTGDHHAEDHSHSGSPTQKLTQANTHESPDTDAGTSSLHHTIGTGANQASAGNHAHDGNVTGTFQLSGDITPSTLSGNVNDYNPTGWPSNSVIRVASDTTPRTITGLQGGADGRIALLINIGSTYNVVLASESTSSSAANRFSFGSNNFNLAPSRAIALIYDSTSSRWRPLVLHDHTQMAGIGNYTHATLDAHVDSTHLAFNDGEGDPADPGSTAADGTSSYAARRDHVHKGPKKAVVIYATHALSDTVNASSTEYLCPFIDGNFTTERAMAVTRAGTVKNFYVRQVGNQPGTGSLVCSVRKNTSTDEISITIAAGAAGPATRSETSTSFTVAAGDFIGFKFVNNASGVSATIGFVIVEIEFDP